jgi:hypothetical protein
LLAIFEVSFDALKVHVFDGLVIEIEVSIVAPPIGMDSARVGIELNGSIESHAGVVMQG